MPKKFFNREISLLEAHWRVLEEALDEHPPLLERVKFLAIYYSNMDEFFMIRVSGLNEQIESGLSERSEDGLTPREQLTLIRQRVNALNAIAHRLFHEDLMLRLAQAGIYLYHYHELNEQQKNELKEFFDNDIYPVLTPLAIDPGHPFPHISNLSLSLAVVIRNSDGKQHFARVKIPTINIPRLVPVTVESNDNDETSTPQRFGFVWLEEVVAAHLDRLFSGTEVIESFPFRVVRDADLEIREDEAGDLLQTIEQSLQRRRFGDVTQLVVSANMGDDLQNLLMENLEIEAKDVYEIEGTLGLSDLMAVYSLDLPSLKDQPFRPRLVGQMRNRDNIFQAIKTQDILLHHPYDSFNPVVDFIMAAAQDSNVLAIKQTIYRVGSKSPIVEALAQACLNGKQVSVLVELKARFDEENNIEWARALERVGVHVVYGRVELKTHCKVALVVRKEDGKIVRYVHLGTGNYNARTARVYTDLGLFTCRPDIGADVSALFNSLTGYSYETNYKKLLVSPQCLRSGLMERIEREIAHAKAGREARLIFKINALTDFAFAKALYKASQAGVKVDLIVRTSCIVVPGVAELSENIRVISIFGRFLEHSRIYYFRNGGDKHQEVLLGSADLMQRNLDRRVETLFPIENANLRNYIINNLLAAYLKDNQKARLLLPDGTYERVVPAEGEAPFNAQDWFLANSQEYDPYPMPEAILHSTTVRVRD